MIDPFSDARMHTPSSFVPSALAGAEAHDNKKLPPIEKEREKERETDKQKQWGSQAGKIWARSLIRSSSKLPGIKMESPSPLVENATAHSKDAGSNTNILVDRASKARQKSEGDDFTTQIERKLRIVLEGRNNAQHYAQASDSEQQFESKISRQKELIRKERLRKLAENQSSLDPNPSAKKRQPPPPTCAISALERRRESGNPGAEEARGFQVHRSNKQRSEIEAIYEKRIRDYKEESLGNKYLGRKKQIALIKEQQVLRRLQDEPQEGIPHFLNINNFQSANPHNQSKAPENVNLVGKKVSSKMAESVGAQKQQDMFENLHNILLGPARKSDNEITKEKPKKTKQHLLEHLKMIQRRLNQQRREDLDLIARLDLSKRDPKPEEIGMAGPVNATKDKQQCHSWRKIDVSKSSLQPKKTNFQEQIERIGKYFENSERSLEKYVENQTALANLGLLKRRNQQQAAQIKA